MVRIVLNGKAVEVAANSSILDAAKQQGIYIPTLCHHSDQQVKANCRICVVEVEGNKNLVTACSTKVSEGMKITTNSQKVRETVRTIIELILANHPQECLTCIRGGNCELRQLAVRYGIDSIRGEKFISNLSQDRSTLSLVRDMNKCIKCGRCAEVCHHMQQVGILYSHNRSINVCVATEYGKQLSEVDCVLCGQCALVCPVGAIYEKDDTNEVWAALSDPQKHVVVQIAPAVRTSIAEEFGQPFGKIATGKIITALHKLGFNKVFDTNFAADLTIVEESNELLQRLEKGGKLPMFTSCCPGWVNYIERCFPEMIPHVSSCKSPQQMFGALAKTYYAQINKVLPKDIIVVSIMPCVAKKSEAVRSEMNASGFRDVDIVLTTRELARMLRSEGIDFNMLQESNFDLPLGVSTGAAALFGSTGGVMEAALRTVYEKVTGEELGKLDFKAVRGMDGIKSTSIDLGEQIVKVAVVHSIANAKKILEMIKRGVMDYTFVEVMCCPGGCIGGSGQPYGTNIKVSKIRMNALYYLDREMEVRKSHKNPEIEKLYDQFLGQPLGKLSHKLLHTYYSDHHK